MEVSDPLHKVAMLPMSAALNVAKHHAKAITNWLLPESNCDNLISKYSSLGTCEVSLDSAAIA